MMDSEDTEDYEFLLEMQQLHSQMEVLIETYVAHFAVQLVSRSNEVQMM